MKKALVTGGAGFIGSHIVDALVARGFAVTVIDDLSSGIRAQVNPKAKFVKLDIRARPKLEQTVLQLKPHVIFHCAAQIDPRVSVSDPEFDADVNVVGSICLLEAARRAKVEKFIFSSSGGAIYGGAPKLPTPESFFPHPFSPYGASKLSFEHYLHCFSHMFNFPYVALRYANVYGPRQSGKGEAGVISVFTQKMLRGEQPVINGDGKQTRDYVYVDDIVRANMLALSPKVNGVFNIGTGREIDVNQIFGMLKELTGSSAHERHAPAKIGEERRSALDAKKAKRIMKWQPTVSFEAGLKRTVAWFESRMR